MDDSNRKAIMEKGQASAHPTNGVAEDEGKRLRPLACRGSSAFHDLNNGMVGVKSCPTYDH